MVAAWFALGTIGLLLLLGAGRAFVNADPKVLARGIRIGGAVICGGLALFFLVRARFDLAMLFGAGAGGALGFWPRGLSPFAGLAGLFGSLFGGRRGGASSWNRARTAPPGGGAGSGGAQTAGSQNAGGGSRASSADRSTVETAWLRMTLDRATGQMDGEVMRGRWIGRRLSGLQFPDIVALMQRCDAQSAALLEAYLDRSGPADWREQAAAMAAAGDTGAGSGGRQAPPAGSGMSREQALDVLGLQPGATPDEIRAAHRRLMKQVHPDQGGSTWLAAQINRAKDVLLGE